MKCPVCDKTGCKSLTNFERPAPVNVGRNFFDEEGREHHHTATAHTTYYYCSNAHFWQHTFFSGTYCPLCNDKDNPPS